MSEVIQENPYTYANYAVDRESKIATVTLTSPIPGNPAPWWSERELVALIDRWERDDDVKVVIIRSSQKDFSAGHDMGGYNDTVGTKGSKNADKKSSNHDRFLRQRDGGLFFRRLMLSLKPTIAEVRGHAIEWACLVAALCDITICSHDAHFGCLGQTSGNSGVHYLPLYISLIGHKRAREMMITGRTVSGRDAARIGLANRSVPVDRLQAEVLNEAHRIALLPLDGIVLGKAYTQTVLEDMGLTTGHATTALAWMLGLRMRFEEDEFSVIRDLKKGDTGASLRRRSARYEPYGGYGRHAETPREVD